MRFAEKKRQIDSLRLTAKAHPVLGFFNDTLFYIYSKSGSFSAEERSVAINGRIKKLADHYRFTPDSIHLSHSESTTDLSFKDNILLSVSDNDALWNNTTRDELAENYKSIIGNEVMKYKKATSFRTLAKDSIGLIGNCTRHSCNKIYKQTFQMDKSKNKKTARQIDKRHSDKKLYPTGFSERSEFFY